MTVDPELKALITAIKQKKNYVYSANDLKGIEEYEALKTLSEQELKVLMLRLTELVVAFSREKARVKSRANFSYADDRIEFYGQNISLAILNGLMRRKLNYTEAEWMELFNAFKSATTSANSTSAYGSRFNEFPINYAIKQLEYFLKKHEPSDILIAFIKEMLTWEEFQIEENRDYYGSDLVKAAKKLRALISDREGLPAFRLKSNDIGNQVNELLAQITEQRATYDQLFELVSDVSSSKPSKKFTKTVSTLQETIGVDSYRKVAQEILRLPIDLAFQQETTSHTYNGRSYEHTETKYLCQPSQQFIKGLVWTMRRYSDKETIRILVALCEKSYQKLPGIGPAAASVGNACILVLGNMRGKDGLGALSRLKLKLRQNNVKKSIDKLLAQGAEKYGVSVEELKEMAVPDFQLEKGERSISFGDYQLKIRVEGAKVVQQFLKPDGTPMKSVPSAIKQSSTFSEKLKQSRKTVKEIQKVFAAQKQRIDNQFILDRSWDLASFHKYYLEHGLVYPIASKLIWTFAKGEQKAHAILQEGQWYTVDAERVEWIDAETSVSLWHPIHAEEAEIVAWREKMMDLQWKQPVKQAFREIYLLTEAELNTRNYSNRMAAHILKQHQFSALASLRNWKYSLMGVYDDGINNQSCQRSLPEYSLTAEYWIDELIQDEDWNDAGIWYHVATDQVRFKDTQDQVVDLIHVPKIVFTEIMRDVDMFVGVASVGNDPQWMDNNGARQTNRDYWTAYSFGNLNEIAKTRKTILERLLPRLTKLRGKARIEGKFLIVDGKLRTYKIHIGSGNILMEPNDQYLCIVPARSAGSTTDKLFIPFEGDKGLSIVLSKAFLLAEDHKITDSSITLQINR